MAEVHVVPESYLCGELRECLFTHDCGSYFCEVALLLVLVFLENIRAYDDGKHGVSEKFQSFVELYLLAVGLHLV